MSTNPESESSQEWPELVGRTGIGRRRLLRAGLSAAPVMLAVTGRSAMAVPVFIDPKCPKGLSPIAFASVAPAGVCVGTSHHVVGSGALGFTPLDWKTKLSGDGPTFNSVFGGGDTRSFKAILTTESAPLTLKAAFCAAYLNALNAPGYPISASDVVRLYQGTLPGVPNDPAFAFAFLSQTWQ